jgi:hypothetical protein
MITDRSTKANIEGKGVHEHDVLEGGTPWSWVGGCACPHGGLRNKSRRQGWLCSPLRKA